MFTYRRIIQVPYWCMTVKHVHALRLPDMQTFGPGEKVESVAAKIEDSCEVYLNNVVSGIRMAISPCGVAVYFSVRADGDVDKAVMIKEGRAVNEGAK